MLVFHSEVRRATKLRQWRAAIGGAALIAATVCGFEGALAKVPTGSKRWAPLDPAALTSLYAGKTWKWKQGAGYFAPDGRFKAWSRSGPKLTQGVGTWTVRGDGLMCFTATWRTNSAEAQQGASPPVDTCFSHEARGNAIAQMRQPNGPWYFFRNSPPRKTDEFFKLRRGDHTRFAG